MPNKILLIKLPGIYYSEVQTVTYLLLIQKNKKRRETY